MQQDISERRSVRIATSLTNAWVAGTQLTGLGRFNQLILLVNFTLGALTTGRIKIDSVEGGSNYQHTVGSVAAGVTTVSQNEYRFTATGLYAIPVAIKTNTLEISAQGNVTDATSSMTIDAIVGVA